MEGINVSHYAPALDLKNIVKYYWIVKVNDVNEYHEMAKISPTGYPELIFHFGDFVSITTKKEAHTKPANSIIAGQITKPVIVEMGQQLNCFCVKLQAWSLSALFGIKSTEFVNQAVCLEDILPVTQKVIHEQLSNAPSDRDMVNLIEYHLRAMLNKSRKSVHPITEKVICSIRERGGNQIAQLANDFHVGSRTLQRRINEDIGISAKMFSRIIRFNHAYHLLKHHQHSSIQDICYHLGYYDLPHLINEFREFSGNSPLQFFKDENVYNGLFTDEIKL